MVLLRVFALALCAALPAHAQYKVTGPDGRITYTDRPVATPPGGQVQAMRGAAAVPAAGTGTPLPPELRAVAARFPVTLYTSADCAPCDSARAWLQQRGIPHAERSIASDDDTAALQRITGGRTVPALMVGAQSLRGFLDADWQATLDLAGYPKESRLPRNWSAGPATPLVARAPAPDGAQAAPQARPELVRPQIAPEALGDAPPAPPAIRF